jgi:copper chaperone NosL
MSKLPRLSRLFLLGAALALGGVYLFPLWRIELVAPQYPEGLGMLIRVDAITGIQPQDLDNINMLNHYIGMRAIVPDAIPELRVMPWVAAGLIAGALAAAAVGRRWLAWAWLASYGALGAAGLYDFWKWSYDYGHDLDPRAAISIPGMAYQPPLIGAKTLLNFVAESWPAAGGVLCGVAFALGAAALLVGRRPRRAGVAAGVAAAALALGAACAPAAPRDIAYHRESCERCRMTIGDPRFGAQLVSSAGRAYTFDSIECVAEFAARAGAAPRGVWVSDYARPGALVPVDSAEFRRLRGPAGSPMGAGLVATRRGAAPAALPAPLADAGPAIAWADVLLLARRQVADAR